MNHEPLRPLSATQVHVDERNVEASLYDVEDLERLRDRARRHQEQFRAVLEHLRQARALAVALRQGTFLLTLAQLEADARGAMIEEARKLEELDEDLATATPASRWQMVLRPTAPR